MVEHAQSLLKYSWFRKYQCKEISVGELPAKVDHGGPQTKRSYVDRGLTIDELCYTPFREKGSRA